MGEWIKRINLFQALLVLTIFHGLLYYLLNASYWFLAALSASCVSTCMIYAIQLFLAVAQKQKRK